MNRASNQYVVDPNTSSERWGRAQRLISDAMQRNLNAARLAGRREPIYSDGSTAEAWLRGLLIDRVVRPLLLDQVAHAAHFGLATNAVYPDFEPVIRGMQPVDQAFHDGLLH
jgi:hypothetical protein